MEQQEVNRADWTRSRAFQATGRDKLEEFARLDSKPVHGVGVIAA